MKVEMKYSIEHLHRFPHLCNKAIQTIEADSITEYDNLYEVVVRGKTRIYHKKAYQYVRVVE